MGNDDWVAGYRAAVARLLEKNGEFVRLNAYDDEPGWGVEEGDYDECNITYGWSGGYEWMRHLTGNNCTGIVSWDHESLRERSLSLFEGTFVGNKNEAGLEMKATCKCGEYTDKWVRWTGTVTEALEVLLRGGE